MKTLIVYFSILWMVLFGFDQHIKAQKVFASCGPFDKPLIVRLNEMVYINCDSAVIITKYRYELYEKARKAVLNYDQAYYEQIITAFDEKGKLLELWADSLNITYNALSKSYAGTIVQSEAKLGMIETRLTDATKNLENAKVNLEDALNSLNKARWEKWLWAAGGIVVGGAIVGALH
jgi:hypothetical protein